MIREEWGCYGNVRFLPAESIKMYDSDGNVVLCKCGKPAGTAAIGKEAFVAWCPECSPCNNPIEQDKFVYKDPTEDQMQKWKDQEFLINQFTI